MNTGGDDQPVDDAVVEDPQRREALFRWGIRLEWFTVSWNVVEGVVAVGAGLWAGSTALTAFGADSSIEVISAAALLWRLRRAGATAGAHEHGEAERRALYVVAVTFFLLAAYTAIESGRTLAWQSKADPSLVGLVLAAVSIFVMPVLAFSKGRVGRAIGSRALQADAVETWVCSYLSVSLLAGVGLNTLWGWWWADALAALLMLPVILWQGWETLEDARGEE